MARVEQVTDKSQVAAEWYPLFDRISAAGRMAGPLSILLHAPAVADRVSLLGDALRSATEVDAQGFFLAALAVVRPHPRAVQGSSSGDDRQTDDVDDFAPIRGLHTDGRAGVVGDWGRARLGDGRRKNPQRATVRLLIEALALAPEQAEALELAARPRPPLRRSK